jgi:hypothetical protein
MRQHEEALIKCGHGDLTARRNNPVSWKIKQGGGRRSSENISNKSTSGCLQPSSRQVALVPFVLALKYLQLS